MINWKSKDVAGMALRGAMLAGGLALLSACSSPPPPQTTSTTTEETTTTAPAGPSLSPTGTLQPGMPGTTTTTQSYSSQTPANQ